MREQLIQYVSLLFAGAKDCEDIKQEILQNTLDRYDDLIAQGKVPEAAYRLAIAGIGDINEILGIETRPAPISPAPVVQSEVHDTPVKKLLRAVAVGLYILCPLPLFVLSEMGMEILGLCGLLSIVAVATVLIILGGKKEHRQEMAKEPEVLTPQQELRNSIGKMLSAITLAVYLIVSLLTSAWAVTWLLFPLSAAVKSLINAILDLKEADEHET